MKHRCFLSLSLLVIAILTGCANKSNNNAEIAVSIDIEKNSDVSFFDIFSKIEVIPLETTKESVFNLSRDITIHKNNFYFLDRNQEALFVFDSVGHYKKKINKKGKGPGEYMLLYDFGFNRFTGNLELMSGMGYIQVYDEEGEIYKQTIRLPKNEGALSYFHNITQDIYVFLNNYREGNKIFFYSLKNKAVIAETYNVDLENFGSLMLLPHKKPFYAYNDTMYFEQVYNGDIFRINPDYALSLKYHWDLGKYNIDTANIKAPKDKPRRYYWDLYDKMIQKYAMGFAEHFENEKYHIFRFSHKKSMLKILLYNKFTEKYFIFENLKENIHCWPLYMDDEALYTSENYKNLDYIVNRDLLDDENKKKLDSVQEEDNPVIVKYYFK